MSERPTLDDVAAEADVSSATVSRYLNNPRVVAKATGEIIRAAIEKTGYIPNLLASELASSKSRLVAVLTPHLQDTIFNDTIEGMIETLSATGINVMLGLTGNSPARADELITAAISRRADAIITTGSITERTAELVRRSETVFIQMWDLPEKPIGIAVGFSHPAVGRELARFVAKRGYQCPHLITANGQRAAMRRDAFLEEWKLLGGEAPTEDTVDIPSRFGHGRGVFARIKRLPRMPDVVVCGSDYLAQAIIIEAHAANLRVPDDLAVIGFGNSALAGEMRPTITTVDIDGRRIVREAITAITAVRNQPLRSVAERIIDVGFRLVARESA